MEPRFAELLVKGGIVSREQLSEAQKKEKEGGSSVTRELSVSVFTSEETLTNFFAERLVSRSLKSFLGRLKTRFSA